MVKWYTVDTRGRIQIDGGMVAWWDDILLTQQVGYRSIVGCQTSQMAKILTI
jgi:hypothetical protein